MNGIKTNISVFFKPLIFNIDDAVEASTRADDPSLASGCSKLCRTEGRGRRLGHHLSKAAMLMINNK